MPLDPYAARFLDMLAASAMAGPKDARSLDSYRAGFVKLTAFSAPSNQGALARDDQLLGRNGPIPIRIYSPPNVERSLIPGLVYLHGGGWIAGGLESHDGLCRAIAAESRCRIVAVDYRLAPEHKFPAGLEDCCDATWALIAQGPAFGVDSAKLAIGGDSAGANLAVAACRFVSERGASLARQLLLCPVIDPFGDWPSRRAFKSGYLLEQAAMIDYLAFYQPPDDPADPRLSPLCANDLGNLPPADVHTAEFDPVRDEGRAYADALAREAVPVRYTLHPGLIHHFYGLTGIIPSARAALAEIARTFGEALGAR